MTVEGLEQDGKLDPVQEGFVQEHGLQWTFLMVELWHRMFLDQPCPTMPPAHV